MKRILMHSALVAGLSGMAGTALAGADTPPTPAPLAPAAQAHDWSGWYGDAYWGNWVSSSAGNFGGVNLGYNMANGSVVYGGEIGYFYDPSMTLGNAQISGRIGATLGDNMLGFGRAGFTRDFGAGDFYLLGLGAQAAMTDSIYLRGEFDWEFPTVGGAADTSLRVGLGWEF